MTWIFPEKVRESIPTRSQPGSLGIIVMLEKNLLNIDNVEMDKGIETIQDIKKELSFLRRQMSQYIKRIKNETT